MIDALADGPNAKNTVVVFTSDHGWYLGQKQMWHKGKLWEETTISRSRSSRLASRLQTRFQKRPVSLIDLYPTLCDLALLQKPAHLDGETLLPILKDSALKRSKPMVTAMGGGAKLSYAARDEQWRYIRYADGSEGLVPRPGRSSRVDKPRIEVRARRFEEVARRVVPEGVQVGITHDCGSCARSFAGWR